MKLAKLVFMPEMDERSLAEARDRGYLSHVFVEIDGIQLIPLFFYDPVRLQQDMQSEAENGRPFIAYPGMIVIPEVTRQAMQQAIENLLQEGYFDYFVPMSREKLERVNPNQWPP